VELIRARQRFVLTTHIRTDADALGSQLGMAGVLETLGKEVLCVNASEVPRSLRFLDPAGKVRRLGVEVSPKAIEAYEVLIILDTSAFAQLAEMGDVIRTTRLKKAVMDHHLGNDDLGAELFKDIHYEASGRLVAEAARHLGVRITPEIARPLFAALATDTGWFRFASTSGETFRLAAELVEAGASPAALYKELYENDALGRLRLVGLAMAKVQTEAGGRLVYTSISREDFLAAGAEPSDSEDIINMMLAVGGTEMAVIFVEQVGGGFKISFRSRCDVDCSRVAATFGGGGHKKAAGAFIAGSLEEAQTQALDAVRAAMR
jgi:phosphoesterase RecJ-like protein